MRHIYDKASTREDVVLHVMDVPILLSSSSLVCDVPRGKAGQVPTPTSYDGSVGQEGPSIPPSIEEILSFIGLATCSNVI